MEIRFKGGVNIAMKIPPEKYDETVAFYRDILLFDVEEVSITHPTVLATHRLEFGQNILWLDCVEGITDSKIWLEMCTGDVESATNYLRVNDVTICNEVAEIDSSMRWIKDPTGNTLLVRNK
ncbi:hypothetical protein FXV77_11625 [Sphingobacterium phlebotomi]|uniref:Glyoxalase-like domain-containing protein n=1 Tax=Sphingobacterium phlebotomi TaxID=2605433 RepID=A0A5D4H6T5_9SPHI|nr:hypothetical protein [Sphingobacterium phlebotomi]TYR35729.1 hypothetical protein FXV77_11625 [Sphingobacterium phlebotomi]